MDHQHLHKLASTLREKQAIAGIARILGILRSTPAGMSRVRAVKQLATELPNVAKNVTPKNFGQYFGKGHIKIPGLKRPTPPRFRSGMNAGLTPEMARIRRSLQSWQGMGSKIPNMPQTAFMQMKPRDQRDLFERVMKSLAKPPLSPPQLKPPRGIK